MFWKGAVMLIKEKIVAFSSALASAAVLCFAPLLAPQAGALVSEETALRAALNHRDWGRFIHCQPYITLEGTVTAYELLFEKDAFSSGHYPGQRIQSESSKFDLDPECDLYGSLIMDRTFRSNFNHPSFSSGYFTVIVSASRDRGPILMWYDGLPQSVKLRKLALDRIDDVADAREVVAWEFIFFKIGYLYFYAELSTGESFLFSPDERLIEIDGMEEIEYRAYSTISSDPVVHRMKWERLLSAPLAEAGAGDRDESYTIPGVESIRDAFLNRGSYWPESEYPYLYEEGEFGGCCHANSGLQVALYYDDRRYDNLVPDPNDLKENRLAAMAELVYEGYAPGQGQTEAFADFANSHGYDFTYDFDWYESETAIKGEIQANRPVQYLIFSSDEVEVHGYTYEHFAHSVVAVGYEEVGTTFTVKLYWGWSSFAEVSFEWESDFAEQFEDTDLIKIRPGGAPDPTWIVINEVYADPAGGLFGDANKDGVRHTYHDEFIELYNTGLLDVDISGWTLGDDDGNPIVFPPGTSIPGDGFLTLFGGGSPEGVPGVVLTDTGKLGGNGLANAGDAVLLRDSSGAIIDQFTYPVPDVRGDRDVSMMMVPDGIGDWVNPVKWKDAMYSPGRPNHDEEELPAVVLNEVLADPPDGMAGDANNDGVRSSYQDEFIEIKNIDNDPVDISYWSVTDDDNSTMLFRFPRGTILWPGSRAVVFGGGKPTEIPGQVFKSIGRISNGLANSRDRVFITTPDFRVMDLVQWPKGLLVGNKNCSMIRVPDGTGAWRLPYPDEPVYSPGAENVGEAPPAIVAINEVLADPPPGLAGDANGDGIRGSLHDEFVELVNLGAEPADISGWSVADRSGSTFTIPNGTVISAGGFVTIFGGGLPTGVPGVVMTAGGTVGNGLSNSSDLVVLQDRYSVEVDKVEWPDGDLQGDINVSMIRIPDGTGGWINSLPPLDPYSPGRGNTE